MSLRLAISILLLSLTFISFSCGQPTSTDENELPMDFLEACTQGQVDLVRKDLEQYPTWANGRSPQGETCLHLAAIMGQTEVTRVVLDFGGDPNIRTTFEHGQRMHPLVWNVFGGHVDTARVLLERGADVNADLDWPKFGVMSKATPLDVWMDLMPENGDKRPELQKFYDMKELLLEYGAKTYSELQTLMEL